MKYVYCILFFCFAMMCESSLYSAVRAGTKPQDVLVQFFNIVAHSLSFAAHSGDKDSQLQDLSAMVTSVVSIIQQANKSIEERERIIALLRSYCVNDTAVETIERCCELFLTHLDH